MNCFGYIQPFIPNLGMIIYSPYIITGVRINNVIKFNVLYVETSIHAIQNCHGMGKHIILQACLKLVELKRPEFQQHQLFYF